ncbi:hypothetical protein ACFWHL_09410 [Streptomyces massasporeus]
MTTLLLAAAAVALLITGGTVGDDPKAYAAPLLIALLVIHGAMPLWVADSRARNRPADDDDVLEPGILGR